MVAWKRGTFVAGHGSTLCARSQLRKRPNALWYWRNEAGEMVASRRTLNDARACDCVGYVLLRKEDRAVERSSCGCNKH